VTRHLALARARRVCDFALVRTAETKERAELEALARADLAAGRWRQARDAFKLLCKLERSTFQPLLVEANVGLARAMLAKGLISDARQVLTYLRTIARPTDVAALEREIAAATTPRRTAEIGPAPNSLVLLLAPGTGLPAERVEWADTLVVAFQRPSTVDGSAEAEQVTADLAAIHEALESMCGGETARALDLVRPLRRESPFAHWRQFVRAIAAYQTGDDGKAARHFGELPASSVPGRARAAWLLAIGDGRDTAEAGAHEAVLEATAAISGYPGWGRALARADALWRAWETQRQALDIVLSHADALVASAGVTRIETMRQPFDPRTMIAVATTVDSHRPPRATQVSSRHAIAAGATCRGFGQYCGRPANCSASRKCRWSAATGSLDSPARADPGIWPTAPIAHGSPVLPPRRWETSRRWSGGGAGLSEGIGFNHASRSITNDNARKHMPIERAQIRERLLPSKQIIIVVSIPLEGRGTSSAPPAQRVHLRCDTAPERLAVEIARLKVDAGVEA
jgi:hypothetical protein